MRTSKARELRKGIVFATNWHHGLLEMSTKERRDFMVECLDAWAKRSSQTACSAGSRTLRKLRRRDFGV